MSLDQAVRAVVDAVEHEGPSPALHYRIMKKHREEWPTLHHALDELRQAWHNEPTPIIPFTTPPTDIHT